MAKNEPATLADLTRYFIESDPYLLEKAKEIVAKSITPPVKGGKRAFNADQIIAICLLDVEERNRRVDEVFDEELIDIFLAKVPFFEEDRQLLKSYPNLKMAFKELYSNNSLFEKIDKFFVDEKEQLKQKAVNAEELVRKKIIGERAGDTKVLPIIQGGLTQSPIGAKHAPWELMYYLFQHFLGVGRYGEPVSKSVLEERKGHNYHYVQKNDPLAPHLGLVEN